MPQDDDDSLLQCVPDVGIDEDLWVELPEIATSPCTLVAALAEDTDVFAQEDWPEGGMWRLDELCEREFHAQSDESLISGPISLTSITTRSPQAPFTRYHHQDIREDPAASGLRYKVSQLAYVEDPGTLAQFASPSHAHHYSENDEQLMQGTGTWQVDAEGFETLDEGDEGDDSDSILIDLDDPDGADVAVFEEPLV